MPYPVKGECRNTGRTRFKKGTKVSCGRKASKETKEKMSKARKGIHKSPATEFKKGQISPWQGKTANKASNWKGGEVLNKNGYVYIYNPNHPRANGIYVRRCILVMEEKISRLLTQEEIVHHKNFIKADDRPKNLRLFKNQSEHSRFHSILRYQSGNP